MDCVPVPERANSIRQAMERRVLMPPNGDMTNDVIRSAEVLVGYSEEYGTVIMHMYWKMSDEELERAKENGYIELTFFGGKAPPVAMNVI